MNLRPLALALALPLLGCCSKGDPTGTTTGKAFAQRIPGVAGIENFARVNPALYRGAEPSEDGFRQLKTMGVKTVVDFRAHHSTKKQVEAAGMTPLEIPMHANVGSVPPSDDDVRKFFEIVLDPARQPVYVHCALGKDRTGTMCALYRLEVDGWTAEEALQEMQAFGLHDMYVDLIRYVKDYKPRGFVKGRDGK